MLVRLLLVLVLSLFVVVVCVSDVVILVLLIFVVCCLLLFLFCRLGCAVVLFSENTCLIVLLETQKGILFH